jgi:hypothetical protein
MPNSLPCDNGHSDAEPSLEEPPFESFFDLIVGTDFKDEASAVEEVGGDPWFLNDSYDTNDD